MPDKRQVSQLQPGGRIMHASRGPSWASAHLPARPAQQVRQQLEALGPGVGRVKAVGVAIEAHPACAVLEEPQHALAQVGGLACREGDEDTRSEGCLLGCVSRTDMTWPCLA